jgi:hypothetical protein
MVVPGLPPIGAFLRPVGKGFAYCLRVLRHFEKRNGYPSIECQRWGMEDLRPVDDGHVSRGHYVDMAPTGIPGVWRDPFDFGGNPRWRCCPLYYRLIDSDASGQRGLF